MTVATRKTTAPAPTRVPAKKAAPQARAGIRVRMYRVGFGDFFLLTVPGRQGPAHIVIDCGVHAANLGTLDECVADMLKETGGHLALVVLTHYHADHMSGFASHARDFARCTVGAVWITNRLDPQDPAAAKFRAQLGAVAARLKLQLQLSARTDDGARQALAKVGNAIGEDDAGGGSNARALQLLQQGFANKAPVYYYEAGMTPTLPDELQGVLQAQILAPAPKKQAAQYSDSDNRAEQYLAAAGDDDASFDLAPLRPFDHVGGDHAARYPARAFMDFEGGANEMKQRLKSLQPDVMLAAAASLDGTLNNQSLVILFTCRGKRLLFVGDAQWGNWAYWLYGRPVTGKDPGILANAKAILGSLDFYKVGHHGSTNANPIPAIAALGAGCACMVSTATGAYGSAGKGTEVPRIDLLTGLGRRTGYRLVRSDWVPAGGQPADPQALAELAKLPDGFSTTLGKPYVDFKL